MGKQIESAAPGGERIEWANFDGKLFVVEPLEVEKDISTVHGTSDAVRANVAVLLGKGNAEEFEDTLIFPKVLQSQTRRKIGRIVVGRLTQGEAKRGQNPPWVFAEASAKDLKAAQAYLNSQAVTSADDDDDEDDDDEAF